MGLRFILRFPTRETLNEVGMEEEDMSQNFISILPYQSINNYSSINNYYNLINEYYQWIFDP